MPMAAGTSDVAAEQHPGAAALSLPRDSSAISVAGAPASSSARKETSADGGVPDAISDATVPGISGPTAPVAAIAGAVGALAMAVPVASADTKSAEPVLASGAAVTSARARTGMRQIPATAAATTAPSAMPVAAPAQAERATVAQSADAPSGAGRAAAAPKPGVATAVPIAASPTGAQASQTASVADRQAVPAANVVSETRLSEADATQMPADALPAMTMNAPASSPVPAALAALGQTTASATPAKATEIPSDSTDAAADAPAAAEAEVTAPAAPILAQAVPVSAGGGLRIVGASPSDTAAKAIAERGETRRAKDAAADDSAVMETRVAQARGQEDKTAITTEAQPVTTGPDATISATVTTPATAGDPARGLDSLGLDALGSGVPGSSGLDRSTAGAPLTTGTAVPLHGPALAQSVGVQIATALSSLPDRPVELALSPEELGKVRMTLTHGHDGGISVAVQAERPETLDLMRRNIDQLASDFRDMGYSSIDFSFSGGQNYPGQQNPETTPEGFASGSGGTGDDLTASTPILTAAADPIRLRLADDSGLDMRL
jgi:flagellar hook-length control protein FliK